MTIFFLSINRKSWLKIANVATFFLDPKSSYMKCVQPFKKMEGDILCTNAEF